MSHQIRQQPRRDANEDSIIAALLLAGLTVRKLSTKGIPDLLVMKPGVDGKPGIVALLEVKTAKGAMRPEQAKFFKVVRDMSLPIYVVRSADEALQAMGVEP